MKEAINKRKQTDKNKEKRREKMFNSCLIDIIQKKKICNTLTFSEYSYNESQRDALFLISI
jgi:hypothetical protein